MKIDMLSDYISLVKLVGNILDSPGCGGNVSVKSGDGLVIKASGQDMKCFHFAAKIDSRKDFTESYLIIGDNFTLTSSEVRPSMEYEMHKTIKSKYVVHYHPVYILPYLCSKEFHRDNLIEYTHPGKELADKIKSLNLEDDGVIYLRNHGVVLFSNSLDYIRDKYYELKTEFLDKNTSVYSPDDLVYPNSDELWLFRQAMENIARKNSLTLVELDESSRQKLMHDPNEKYRSSGK